MPGDLPRASQEPVGTVCESRRRLTKNLKRSGRVPEAILGAGRDPKIDLWRKRWPRRKRREAFFHGFSVSSLFWVGFCIDFQAFSDVFLHVFLNVFVCNFISFSVPNLFRISHFVYDFPKTVMLLKLQFLLH